MANRIGFNIEADGFSDEEALEFARGASSYLIRDNVRLAQKFHENTGAIIISRSNYPDDTSAIPQDHLLKDWGAKRQSAPDVYHYWPNEPNPGRGGDLKRFLAKLAAFMRECHSRRIRFCLGNFAGPAIIYPDDVDNGLWDDFLKAACECAVDGAGYVGFHDYASVVLPFGCAGANMPIEELYTRPLRQGWPDYRTIVADHNTDYHTFRWVPLMLRAEQLGYPHGFDIILTECFWDRMGDLEGQGRLAKADGIAGEKVFGLPTLKKVFDVIYPGVGWEDAAVAMLDWCEQTYPDHVKGFNFFCLDNSGKWLRFDMHGDGSFLEKVAAIRKA